MSKTIDLNRLAAIVRDNQQSAKTNPAALQKRIFVDRDARLKLAGDLERELDRQKLAVVQQDTFHQSGLFRGTREAELETVRRCMPANTREVVSAEGVRGWLYEFTNEFGDTNRMFAYRDGSYWQVLVIHPVLEDYYRSPHTGHIYGDGRICFGVGMESGRRTLSDAYAKSVLWSNGLSAMIHGKGKTFPFNYND